MTRSLGALALALAMGATMAAPQPAAATRYVPESQCVLVIHRAKLPPYDEEQAVGIADSARWGFGAELDVRLTSDNQLVMVHDDTLRRVTGGKVKQAAEDMTLAEITAVRLARGGRVLTLAEALSAAQASGTRVLVEIKRHGRYRQRWDSVGLPALAATIHDLGMEADVYVGSAGSVEFSELAPELQTFFRVGPGAVATTWIIDHGYDLVQLDATHYDPALVAELRTAGILVGSRQINHRETLLGAFGAGLRLFQGDRGRLLTKWCEAAAAEHGESAS